MSTMDVGRRLVELCQAGNNREAVETLYAHDIVSIEAGAPPGQSPITHGRDAALGKGLWWVDNHEIHSFSCEGPFPHGNRFIVRHNFDITFKPTGQRHSMKECALYTVKDGKIVHEEFFYTM